MQFDVGPKTHEKISTQNDRIFHEVRTPIKKIKLNIVCNLNGAQFDGFQHSGYFRSKVCLTKGLPLVLTFLVYTPSY